MRIAGIIGAFPPFSVGPLYGHAVERVGNIMAHAAHLRAAVELGNSGLMVTGIR